MKGGRRFFYTYDGFLIQATGSVASSSFILRHVTPVNGYPKTASGTIMQQFSRQYHMKKSLISPTKCPTSIPAIQASFVISDGNGSNMKIAGDLIG